jgi:hypothetical protein
MNCLTLDNNIISVTTIPAESCTGFAVLTPAEYQQTLEGPFVFDAALFSEFVGWFLLSFVSGHIAGRISRLMRI